MILSSESSAIVTGGASGLGAAVATMLAQAGLHVTVFDLNEEIGQQTAKDIGAEFAKVDVADAASVAKGLAGLSGPPLRVAMNCAGIGPAAKTVSRGVAHDPALFAKTIQVNLIGSFNVASQSAAIIAANDPVTDDGERGVIISTASVAAYEGQIGQVAYAASKGGIVAMTLPMARDLAKSGIRVCTIAPGIFHTPLLDGLPEEVQRSLGEQVPFPSRLGRPDEFASTAKHIIENSMMNGEIIRLDGAIRMAPR